MIDRKEIKEIVEGYYTYADKIKIGTIASHSGLDICDGAVEEEFRTIEVCQAGREKTYSKYFRSQRDPHGKLKRGIIDEKAHRNRRLVDIDRWKGTLRIIFTKRFADICAFDTRDHHDVSS